MWRGLPPDEREQYLAELDEPLDPEAAPTEATLESEGQNFMALMQMTGGSSDGASG